MIKSSPKQLKHFSDIKQFVELYKKRALRVRIGSNQMFDNLLRLLKSGLFKLFGNIAECLIIIYVSQ